MINGLVGVKAFYINSYLRATFAYFWYNVGDSQISKLARLRFRKYRRKVKFYFYLACADKPWCENFPFCKDSQALRDRIVGDCPIQCKELRCKAYWKDDVTESDPVAPEDARAGWHSAPGSQF